MTAYDVSCPARLEALAKLLEADTRLYKHAQTVNQGAALIAMQQDRMVELSRENQRLGNELCDRADRMSEMRDRLHKCELLMSEAEGILALGTLAQNDLADRLRAAIAVEEHGSDE